MSPIDYNAVASLREFGPKVGESKAIHIRKSEKVEDPEDKNQRNFKSTIKNFGFRYELTLTNGRIFDLNVWKLFYAFQEKNVQDGDKVQIDHPGEGVYVVTILEQGTGIDMVVPDLEKEEYLAHKKAGTLVDGKIPKGAAPLAQSAPVATPPVATPPAAQAPVTQAPVTQAPITQVPPAVTPPAATNEELDLPF